MTEKVEKKKIKAKKTTETPSKENTGSKTKADKPGKDTEPKKMTAKRVKEPASVKESPEKKSAAAVKKKSVKKDDSGSKKELTGSKEKVKPEKSQKKTKKKEYVPRLHKKYLDDIVPQMTKRFGYTNKFEVPKLTKIVLNIGMGEALQNKKLLDAAVVDLSIITGQKPIITKAKKSVSNFKLREGNPIGCKVTLRNERMFDFLDRYIAIAIPRIRDFRGMSLKSFDGFGNYSVGVKEQIIFPEIDYDKVESIHGLDICIVTTAKKDEEALALLRFFGMPFVETQEALES